MLYNNNNILKIYIIYEDTWIDRSFIILKYPLGVRFDTDGLKIIPILFIFSDTIWTNVPNIH